MVRLVLIAATLVLTLAWPAVAGAEPLERGANELILFYGDGCPYCEREREWLAEARDEYPGLTVREYEVWYDEANQALLTEVAEDLGFEVQGVPVTVLGDRHWIGFSEPLRADMVAAIESALDASTGTGAPDPAPAVTAVDVPLLGEVTLGDSLVAATLLIGFVDGMNPCSLWVITVLLAIVVRTGYRRRVFAIGITFLLVTALVNGLFILGVYSALGLVSHLGAVQVVVALVAGAFGVVGIKDYFAFKQGVTMSISDSAKPGLYHRMRRAAGHEALLPALAATTVLAMGASLLEIPCTAGFPLLWAGLLEANGVGTAEAAGLLVLYLIPFLVDELLVFTVAVVTMRSLKMQERHGRLLKLVAGTMMLALAVTVLLDPEAMSDPVTALLVFLAAVGAAALIHLVWTRRNRPADLRNPSDLRR
jgi:glutaredoxin